VNESESESRNETDRLAALERYGILDTPPEPEFDDFTQLASLICQTPIALISLVDGTRQWFKSRVGLEVCETPRNFSFCQYAIQGAELMEIPDAQLDERYLANPLVTGEPHIRFYAGAPLTTPDGHRIGTLCVIDRAPRRLTSEQRDGLARLARQVMLQLESRIDHVRLTQSAAALSESNERTEQIIASALDAVVTMDVDGLITSWNPQAEVIFGWSAGEVIGRKMSEVIIPPSYREAHERGHQRLIQTGEARVLNRRIELSAVRRDGVEFPVELTVAKVMVAEKAHFSAFIRDLTDIREAEALLATALEEKNRMERERLEILWEHSVTMERRIAERTAELEHSRRQFQDLFEFAPDALVMTDRAGIIQMTNQQAEQMFGWPPAELLGQSVEVLLPSALQGGGPGEPTRLLEAGEKSSFPGRRKDGTEFPLEMSLSPVQTEGGMLLAAAMRDISQRRQLEQEVARISSHEQERIAHELHDHLGAYLAGISFRFKSLAETLERRAIPEAATAQQLVGLVNDGIDMVRNFARLLAPVDLEAGGLAAGLSQLGKEMETAFRIKCRIEVEPELPPLTPEQSLQLYRIAQEATRNGIQHGKARLVIISVRCEPKSLILKISNDGKPWSQARERAGGMGLRIMRHRAVNIGGTFTMQSDSADCTSVICRLPLPSAGADRRDTTSDS
jgi:PAS domain S-box-containing protein